MLADVQKLIASFFQTSLMGITKLFSLDTCLTNLNFQSRSQVDKKTKFQCSLLFMKFVIVLDRNGAAKTFVIWLIV